MIACIITIFPIFAIFTPGDAATCKASGPFGPDDRCCDWSPYPCWAKRLGDDCNCESVCRFFQNCCSNYYKECKRGKTPISRYRDSNETTTYLSVVAEKIAKSIMSEAGGEEFATKQEQIAVGYASQRNPKHVTSTLPTWKVQDVADDVAGILIIEDNSQGANHWYSPMSMPKEGDSCIGFDCGGGLEQTPGLSKKYYKPRWANEAKYIPIDGVRPAHLKFYKLP